MITSQVLRDFLIDLSLTPAAVAARVRLGHPASSLGYIGWTGHGNLGDEAMFQAIAQVLKPSRLLTLLPAPAEQLLARLGLGAAQRVQAVLLGGGTLINPYYSSLAQLASEWKLPLFTVGTGVGSAGFGMPAQEGSLSGWSDILRTACLVSVRGPESQRLLHRAGILHAEVIGDPALSLTPERMPVLRTRPRLLINLGPLHAETSGQALFPKVAAALKRLLQKNAVEILGIALGHGDRAALERFRNQHSLREMIIQDHRHSGEQMLQAMQGAYAVISVRLHAAVLASCVGVPSVLFAYRAKCLDFMESMDTGSFAIPLTEATKGLLLEECLEQIFSEPAMGERIYSKALFWKRMQQDFYRRLNASLPEMPSRSD